MKNYQDSDYALNCMNKKVVYNSVVGIIEITETDYLVSALDMDEDDFCAFADFREFKAWSDEGYRVQDRADNKQTRRNISLHGLDETGACAVPSPEDEFIERPERIARERRRRALGKRAFETLTQVQRRRYRLYHVDGKTTREIAEIEGVHFTAVHECLQAAEKKIKNVLGAGKNIPLQNN